jgi:hypothetical protein
METIETESTDMDTTDMQTSNPDDHSTGSAANDSPDGAKDQNSDDHSNDHSEGNADELPPASQLNTSQQQATKQQATNQDLKNDEARKSEAKNGEAKKVAGLSLSAAINGPKTARPSLQTRLAREQASTQSKSRKKKLIGYTVGGVVLLGIGLYFYHQIQSLVDASTTGLRTPGRPVRLDSTAWKLDPLSTAYEKEAKNRYQDSLHHAIEKDAMGHIVMDWGRLYNVESYDQRRNNTQASKKLDTVSVYGEKSLYDLLSGQTGKHQADSLALEQKRLAAIQASNRQAAKGSAATKNTATGLTASSTARKGSPAGTRNRVQPNGALTQWATRQAADNSLFNVVHGSSNGGSSSANERGSNSGNGNSGNGNYSSGNRSETVTDAGAEPVVVRAVIIRAVVHGNHKVANSSKVAFRLLEGVSFQGMYFEKNTILIGIATFRNGRVNFSGFRSKSLSSVSASQGAVASTALPLVCYDTDMVAGIPVSDQSPVETQTRQAGTSALSDAASDASYSIPYGSLARAASSLTRGVASGKRQQREKFIDLADNYPVLLELIPPKAK